MKQTRLLALCASLLLSSACAAQTMDEIIAKNLQARGGHEKLKQLTAFSRKGTIFIPGATLKFNFISINMRPHFVRVESNFSNQKMIEAYDGVSAWSINPLMGSTKPEIMPKNEAKSLIEQAEFDPPFLDYKSRNIDLRLTGKEQIGDRDAFLIKAYTKTRAFDVYCVDTQTYHIIQKRSRRIIRGKTIDTVTRFSDFRATDGLVSPHFIEVEGPQRSEIRITEFFFNQKYGKELFSMPKS